MDTDPVIVTEDAPAEQEGVSCLIISCDASFAYASIKFFFCGQMWPMASRRVAVRFVYSRAFRSSEVKSAFALVSPSHHA